MTNTISLLVRMFEKINPRKLVVIGLCFCIITTQIMLFAFK
jgi:hypothetical protein